MARRETNGESIHYTLDLAAVAFVREVSHLPVVVDPSHAAGRRDLVPAASRAALAVGADGLIIEVHPCPERALSDGPQSLDPGGFAQMMESFDEPLRKVARPTAIPLPDARPLHAAYDEACELV